MDAKDIERRFRRLYEYTYLDHGVFEDDEPADDGQQPGGMQGPDDPGAGAPGGQDGAIDMQGGATAGQQPGNGADDEVDGAALAPNAGMDAPEADMDGMDGMGPGPDGPGNGNPEVGPDDSVVDISDLTKKQSRMAGRQKAMLADIDGIGDKITRLYDVLGKVTDILDANDAKIDRLAKELDDRMPTNKEKMNVRLNAGGNPFSQKPEEYWRKFQDVNHHYDVTANNDAPQYQIRKSDITGFNPRMMMENVRRMPSTLKDYFTV